MLMTISIQLERFDLIKLISCMRFILMNELFVHSSFFQIVYEIYSIHHFLRKIHENIFTIIYDKRYNGGEIHHILSRNITIIDHAKYNKRP